MRPIRVFAHEVTHDVVALLSGIGGVVLGALGAVGLFSDWIAAAPAFWAASVICLFVAFYRAWLKQYNINQDVRNWRRNLVAIPMLMNQGSDLKRVDATNFDNIGRYYVMVKAWGQSVREFVAKHCPDPGIEMQDLNGLIADNTVGEIENNLALLEAIKSSFLRTPSNFHA